jgi:spore germination protein YaaH
MKNLLSIVLISLIFITTGCSDLDVLATPDIKLGVTAKSTDILSVVSTGGTVTVQYAVTTGAKYSVQVYKFAATEPTKTLPLTAEEEIVTKIYDFTDLEDGLYDITLTDINGGTVKKPLVIKR